MTLYVSDLDGTLLRPDATISEAAAKKLNTLISNGVLFTYATARSFLSASPLVRALKLNCPAVTFNGVFVVDPKTGEHLAENVPDEQQLELARAFIVENAYAPIVYAYIDGRERVSYLADRLDDVRTYVESKRGDRRLRPVADYDALFEGSIFYITLFDLTEQQRALADEVFTRGNGFAHNFQQDTYNDSIWYEIYSDCAGKAAAVVKAASLAGADEIVCFGDNKNDIPMLLCADRGIAVSNACEELIAAADEVIGSNVQDAVAEYIWQRESARIKTPAPARKKAPPARKKTTPPAMDEQTRERFSAALADAMCRTRGNHGSVGTQKEKLIHATLKNYYVPSEASQEIRIGRFIADAVGEGGIYEIQSRSLHLLRDKLEDFTQAAHVTVVHPAIVRSRTLYISEDTGEVADETQFRSMPYLSGLFEELYSLRGWLDCENVGLIIACLKAEKRVFYTGKNIPDLRSRSARKRIHTEKVPLELVEEIRLFTPRDYMRFMPQGLDGEFTKTQFCKAAKESRSSLRLEVLRSAGAIVHTGNIGRQYVYRCAFTDGKDNT